MSRSWQRLFAWVGLVAFLAADPHAVAAVASRLAPPTARRCGTDTWALRPGSASECPHGLSASCCGRCAKEAGCGSQNSQARVERSPGGPACPACPKCPSCPVPGGCHYCNAAKVPCLPDLFSGPETACAVSDAPTGVAPLYASPSSGRLCRPPKA